MFKDTSKEEIDLIVKQAWQAFLQYSKMPLKKRAEFMRMAASEIESLGDDLISMAQSETNLPEARLKNERARTIFQLQSYADACEKGDWMDLRIDTSIPDRN